MAEFQYEYVSESERLSLTEQRIAQLERDHFNMQLNELANVTGQTGIYDTTLASNEEAISRLREERDALRKDLGIEAPQPVTPPAATPATPPAA